MKHITILGPFLKDVIKAVKQWIKKLWFESRLKARLKRIEWDNMRDYYYELNEDFEPVYREYTTREPGSEAAKLGGAMRLTAKHHKSYESEEDLMDAYSQTDL